ncbi:hypothetical protein M5D96_001547, partial [Drosophila gunungcola]
MKTLSEWGLTYAFILFCFCVLFNFLYVQ